MQYTRLGKSDLLVSRICMGCMGFGDPSTGQHSWTLTKQQAATSFAMALKRASTFTIPL